MGEIFHVRMRLLDETVPVQPLVQKEEVARVAASPLSPLQVEMHAMPEDHPSKLVDLEHFETKNPLITEFFLSLKLTLTVIDLLLNSHLSGVSHQRPDSGFHFIL